jgi:hypothetical protein
MQGGPKIKESTSLIFGKLKNEPFGVGVGVGDLPLPSFVLLFPGRAEVKEIRSRSKYHIVIVLRGRFLLSHWLEFKD